jgi:uncharacterized protein (TIGR00730 family)
MSPKTPKERLFPTAQQDAGFACQTKTSAQTEHPSYRLAYADTEFLLRDDLRPVRFQLELMKPELIMQEHGIASTVVIYGSARIPEPGEAQAQLAAAKTDQQKRIAQSMVDKARFYAEARKLAQHCSSVPQINGERHFVVCSGGGPSIMEAANRGAADVGAPSIGLNIVLPHEQLPNPFVTPALSFQFHYFALRKLHFLMRARAVCVFPGGFGTMDELFETLTLIQTTKIKPMPIILFGRNFWRRMINFDGLVEEGVISPGDVDLFQIVETADEAWAIIAEEYGV